jgi:hypothetical protein
MVRLSRSELVGSLLVSPLEPHPESKAMAATNAKKERDILLGASISGSA